MTICVTGGSSGIGRAIALRFAPQNTVFINYHNDDDAAEETAAEIRAAGGVAHLVKADLATPSGCRQLIDAIKAKTDTLDQLVHAAAAPIQGDLLAMASEELDRAIAVNATALIHLVSQALPLMQPGSSVIYISSRGSKVAIAGYGALGAAKAFAEHIIRYLVLELAPRGIRINAVAPGPIETRAYRAMFPSNFRERLAASEAANPSKRGMSAAEAADAVALLCQPELQMLQGQVISIDGGLSLK